ncbi:hypothetical protein G9F31_00945 [Acinetobacter sp. 187]|uniref:hypothetical protein n=1 Tax=Acinetobacter lanii TaxID=2715163 RepID=UPI00140BA96A|nr:hypothetical protein [Acinetobacter lanii]NHC02351.1 hypothetical protein [Acinetobacter lanii]
MNLSKQEFLSVGDSAKYIQDKRKLREQLEKDVAEFLAKGGEIKSALGVESKPSVKGKMFNQPKQCARQVEDQASLADVRKINTWCKERKGRGKELCIEMKVAHAFVSQIISQTRPCSKQRYAQIVVAMAAIEIREKAHDN